MPRESIGVLMVLPEKVLMPTTSRSPAVTLEGRATESVEPFAVALPAFCTIAELGETAELVVVVLVTVTLA